MQVRHAPVMVLVTAVEIVCVMHIIQPLLTVLNIATLQLLALVMDRAMVVEIVCVMHIIQPLPIVLNIVTL